MTKDFNRDAEALESLLIDVLAQAAPIVELDPKLRKNMRRRILSHTVDEAPDGLETVRGDSVAWERLWPGVWGKVLKRNLAEDLQITVFRMEPKSSVPAHEHVRAEECLVLEGELLIGSHRLVAGDLHIAAAGSRHPDITSLNGAMLLVRSGISPT